MFTFSCPYISTRYSVLFLPTPCSAENVPPSEIRLFFTQAYYRGPLNFSDELLASAEKGLEKFENLVDKINQELNKSQTDGVNPELDIKQFEDKFIATMDDDFNTELEKTKRNIL